MESLLLSTLHQFAYSCFNMLLNAVRMRFVRIHLIICHCEKSLFVRIGYVEKGRKFCIVIVNRCCGYYFWIYVSNQTKRFLLNGCTENHHYATLGNHQKQPIYVGRIQQFQNEVLRTIVNAPWCVPNSIIQRDFNLPTAKEVIKSASEQIALHLNTLADKRMDTRKVK